MGYELMVDGLDFSGDGSSGSKIMDYIIKSQNIINNAGRGIYAIRNTSLDVVSRKIESPDYVGQFFFDRSRFIPRVDFSDPGNFAKFGSAEQYYVKSIENISRFYPYDGSLKERMQWHNSSSYFDNYIFEYEYPRTNGYIEIGETWGSVSATVTPGSSEEPDIYKLSDAPQYISVRGGPHAASIPAYATGSYEKELSFKEKEQKANIFDATTNQIQNFTIDGTKGNTVEFWLKLPFEPSKSQTSPSHAYFDLWNGESAGASNQYGRFLIETRYTTSGGNPDGEYVQDSLFHVTYMSGTSGVQRAPIGSKDLTSSLGIDLADWNHIAFTVENHPTTDNLEIKLYANGNLIETTVTGSRVQPVSTGSFNSTIGAYKRPPSIAARIAGPVYEGYGSLTGSLIDEFRFWTIHRDSDDIKFNWFKQVAGGTNSDFGAASSKFYEDINPVNLGVYFKFNEGATLTSSIDRVALDYSGRVSNGYISNYTAAMRYTGSAIVEANAALREFKDPIIYNFHPSVVSYESDVRYKGREFDGRNSMYLYNMLPSWIIDEDEQKGRNEILKLNQIMASYFDNLFLQIQSLPRLKDIAYVSGSSSGSLNKPLPFADKLLSNAGFVVPEIFSNASAFEALANRDDDREFDRKLTDIKNEIYTNLYNNLLFINKTKGTEKSITNIMRCFGVDDDLYSINFYADNAELDLKGNFKSKTSRKSYADFNYYTRHGATVYQMTASNNANSVSFITGSLRTGWDSETGFTLETEVIFPKQPAINDPSFRFYEFPTLSASLFGIHEAITEASSTPGDTTNHLRDYGNFQVYAVKEKASRNAPESENVRFILTSSNPNAAAEGLISEITTETYKKVYNNERWNLSVRMYPSRYPNIGMLSGSEFGDLTVQFSGYNMVGDIIQNSFDIKKRMPLSTRLSYLVANKRIYIGAHRTNFTGSLLVGTNAKISSCRYWGVPLTNDELKSHAMDPKNYGVYNSMQSAYLLEDRQTVAATATLDTTTPIVFTSTAAGQERNGKQIKLTVLSAGNNPSDTVLLSFSSTTDPLFINVKPNDGTNNGFTPVNLTTAELVEAINTGAVVGKNINIISNPESRTFQTATGGDATALASGGEGDDGVATFSGGVTAAYPVEVPRIKTLAMNWDFDNITGSDTGEHNGGFEVQDFSSGSGDNRYGLHISNLLEKQHTGRGAFFETGNNQTGSISREYVHSYRQQVPENLNNQDAIKVLNRDDEFFTRRTRPITFSFSVEKSMYQSISEEMLNFIAASKEASAMEDLIGAPVNKYRDRYKELEKIRNIFFERVGNVPDLDRYIEYFKWLDTSIGQVIQQVVPASSRFSTVRNVIESHVFERSKYKHKYPTLDKRSPKKLKVTQLKDDIHFRDIITNEEGVYEVRITTPVKVIRGLEGFDFSGIYLRRADGWEFNSAPIEVGILEYDGRFDEKESLSWWRNRVPFSLETPKSTGNADIDNAINQAYMSAFSYYLSKYSDVLDEDSLNPLVKAAGGAALDFSVDSGDKGAFNDQNRSRPKKDRNFRNVVFAESPAGSGNRISFNTNTIERQPNTNTPDKIDPNRKFKPEFKVQIPSISTERGYDGRKYAPLSFQSSSTDNPFITGSTPWHIGYEVSTQHLQDYYLDNKDIPMQGPFTEQNVGGYAYRHSGLHLHIGQSPHVKPEAWYALRTITANPNGINFDFYNIYDLPGGVNAPRATMLREEAAKRPLNIKNIKSTTSSFIPSQTSLPPFNELGQVKAYNGNYEKDYQIVQIAGRDTNNRYFFKNNGISTASFESIGTPSVSGAYDWAIPVKGKSEHIFVSRFSAPGGPEVNGPAFLNYESEVYSPYNAMPFRNLSVRQPLRTLLTRHTAFGGYDSVIGSPSASFKKTQRNGRKYIKRQDIFGNTLTSSVYDNYFIQHQIPQSDQQYAWISSSTIAFPFGFSEKDYQNKSYAATDLVFVSASLTGAEQANGELINVDFVGLNSVVVDTLTTGSNLLESSANIDLFPTNQQLDSTLLLNSILLNRNGAYGFSTRDLSRSSYHPLIRNFVKHNTFSVLTEKTSISPGDLKLQKIKTQTLNNFTEPMVSFKYKPLEHDILVKEDDGQGTNMVELDYSYANMLGTFTNNKIDDILDFKKDNKDIKLAYNFIKKSYISNELPDDLKPSILKLCYREVVFPRERNTGLAKARGRENYTVSKGQTNFDIRLGDSLAFWKDNIDDRLRTDAVARNAEGLIIASGSSFFGLTDMSIWPLDAEEPFYDLHQISASYSGGPYNPYYWAPLHASGATLSTNTTSRFANLNKNGELSCAGYIYNLLGINLQGKVRELGAPTASGPVPNFITTTGLSFKPTASFQFEYPNMIMSGAMVPRRNSPSASLHLIPPYRTDVLSGKSPWFNSYEDYSEDIRRIAKDYTVLPEFRITDHIDYYLKEGFFADNNKFLDLIGASLSVSSSATNESGSFNPDFFKVYSHSDFMKHFSVIQEDHKKNDTAFASKIRLEANAVKKLLPYQGFYPALRSVQLGHIFSSSYAPFISGSNRRDGDQERLAALYQPFFAPGVFFNTIKSGIAVSYPVHTSSAPQVVANTNLGVSKPTSGSMFVSNQYQTVPNYSFPFEAILDPDQFLPLSSSVTGAVDGNNLSSKVFFAYPNFTGSVGGALFLENYYVGQSTSYPYVSLEAADSRATGSQPQLFFEWSGGSDPKYSLAANNFFAESVDFFLDDGTLTSFISKPEKDFKSMVSGSVYYMDVLLYKTGDFVSYEGPGPDTFRYDGGIKYAPFLTDNLIVVTGDGILNTRVGARGMHYGPSYKAHGLVYGSTGTGSVPYAAFRAQDPTYAPHTPPYFYGTSRARIAFKPHEVRDMQTGEAAKFTLEEILSNSKISTSYQNENQLAKTLQEDSYRNNFAAGIAQMQLSSSVNLFGQLTLKEVEYGTEKNPDGTFKAKSATTPVVQGTNDAWIIETKFECPSVNLAHMDTGSLGAAIGHGNEKYFTRGIWKGYGVIPSGSEGIFLQLKESFPQILNDTQGGGVKELSGSLIDVCGFKASKERVGKIRSKKIISEAIIAVPIDEKGKFFSIDPDMFLKQKTNHETSNKALLAGDFGAKNDIGQTSITQMIEKMSKFSLPPQMDFLNNPNIDPFVMYIFEFNHTLDKQDLADIWQNLMPKISRTAEKASVAIEHQIGVNYEFFGQYKEGQLPNNIRWMVFKVKQKARNNFMNVTQQSETAKGFSFTALKELQGVSSNPEAELTYSYNWPYDFFSLVELAQIESEVVFEPPEE